MMDTKGEGVWFSQNLRKDKNLQNIPILMITAVNQESNMHFDLDTDEEYLPVDGFIEKPVEPEDLLKEIVKLIEG